VDDNTSKIYGISQNPNTRDYIMVLRDELSEKDNNQYADVEDEWYKSCQINDLRAIFTNWSSGNKNIDKFVQEKQLSLIKIVNRSSAIIFEWISYNQLDDIKVVYKGYFFTVCSAIWKDGPLHYKKKWMRESNKKVILKYLDDSKGLIDEFLYKV